MQFRFNPVVDKRTNFRTRNICCVPLKLNGKVGDGMAATGDGAQQRQHLRNEPAGPDAACEA